MTRAIGMWLMMVMGIVAVAGCGQQKPAPAVDETDPGVAADG